MIRVKPAELKEGDWFLNDKSEDKRSWSVLRRWSATHYKLRFHDKYLERTDFNDIVDWVVDPIDVEEEFRVITEDDVALLTLQE